MSGERLRPAPADSSAPASSPSTDGTTGESKESPRAEAADTDGKSLWRADDATGGPVLEDADAVGGSAAGHARSLLLERAAAVGLLAALVIGAGWSLLAPLGEAFAAREDARARLARYEAARAAPREAGYDPAEIAARHADDAEAQLALQAVLDRQARAATLSVQTLRPASAESLGDVGRAVWVELDAVGDLQALTDVLAALDRERPLVLIRALDIEAGAGSRPDADLRIRIEAGRVWRAGEGR